MTDWKSGQKESMGDNQRKEKTVKEKLKTALIATGFIVFILFSIFDMFFKTSDEIGFLGAGKVGRQVLIQTFDYEMKPDVNVDSDFNDRPFILRLIVGEPLRTTLRFNIQNENKYKASRDGAESFLSQPAQIISDRFEGKIVMQDGYEVTPEELRQSMQKNNVNTIEDLLAGFGFKKFEIYLLDHPRVEINISGVKNVGHTGGN